MTARDAKSVHQNLMTTPDDNITVHNFTQGSLDVVHQDKGNGALCVLQIHLRACCESRKVQQICLQHETVSDDL